jgi:hypothetical protein
MGNIIQESGFKLVAFLCFFLRYYKLFEQGFLFGYILFYSDKMCNLTCLIGKR